MTSLPISLRLTPDVDALPDLARQISLAAGQLRDSVDRLRRAGRSMQWRSPVAAAWLDATMSAADRLSGRVDQLEQIASELRSVPGSLEHVLQAALHEAARAGHDLEHAARSLAGHALSSAFGSTVKAFAHDLVHG